MQKILAPLTKAVRELRSGERAGIKKIIVNTGWLFADKIVRMGCGVIVGVWIARYLKTDLFGVYNYVLAFSLLFSTLGTLNMDQIVVKDLLGNKYDHNDLLGTAFILRLCGGILSLIISTVSIFFFRGGDLKMVLFVALSSSIYVFQAFYVIDFYFQAQLKSRLSFLSLNIAFIIITVVKLILLLNHSSLTAFLITYALEYLIAAICYIVTYKVSGYHISQWKYSGAIAKDLLKSSYPLIISGFAIMIYMRLDQVMIGEMLNDSAVGIYSAAVKLGEVWFFIPMAIANSVFPSLTKLKEAKDEVQYYKRLQQMYSFMAMLGLTVAIATTLLAPFIIKLLYGEEYMGAAHILSVTIWTGVWICISTIHTRWLILEGLQRFSIFYTGCGAIINVIANLFLIRKFGAIGAAYATLLAQFMPAFVAYVVLKRMRKNLRLMFTSVFVPFIYLFNLFRSRISRS